MIENKCVCCGELADVELLCYGVWVCSRECEYNYVQDLETIEWGY